MILKFLFPLEAKGWHLSWSTGSKCQRNYATYTDTGGQNTRVCSLLLVKTGKEKKKKNKVSAYNPRIPCNFAEKNRSVLSKYYSWTKIPYLSESYMQNLIQNHNL